MNLNPMRVLIVDDERGFLDTLVERMRMREIKVEGVYSGYDALAILSREAFDVVILDVRMPGMDGIETLEKIKHRHPMVEVIMLTGHASTEVAIQGMELGAFDYLLKPIEVDQLIYRIQDAYQKKFIRESKMTHSASTIENTSTNSGPDKLK